MPASPLDADAISNKLTSLRWFTWANHFFLAFFLAEIIAPRGTVPTWLAYTMLPQLLLLIISSCIYKVMEDRARRFMLAYISENDAQICPKDLYPLKHSDQGHLFCTECGISIPTGAAMPYWKSVLRNSFRWTIWLLFARPRITMFSPPERSE